MVNQTQVEHKNLVLSGGEKDAKPNNLMDLGALNLWILH
jgi:hypothetical protein